MTSATTRRTSALGLDSRSAYQKSLPDAGIGIFIPV